MKQRHEITQIGGEAATKRLEEALEREGNPRFISIRQAIEIQRIIDKAFDERLEEKRNAQIRCEGNT